MIITYVKYFVAIYLFSLFGGSLNAKELEKWLNFCKQKHHNALKWSWILQFGEIILYNITFTQN